MSAVTDVPGGLCTFMLAGEKYAFDIRRVQEIVPNLPITPVPQADTCVEGLANLRGNIVPILSLRERLEIAPRDANAPYFVVILRVEEHAVGVTVDDPREAQSVEAESFAPPPETLSGAAKHLIWGVFRGASGLLPVLDADRVIGFQPTPEPAD